MFYQVYEYIRWDNVLEWVTYVSSIIYVSTEFKGTESLGVKKCSDSHPSVGAVSIFSAWMCLLLFIRKFPKLGIYVVMFTDILYTFVKFSLIFVLFIVAFALSFYTLLADQASFKSAGRALVKTGIGLAVDDIKGVQDQALLKRQAMLVDLALDVEKAFPRKLRKNLLVLQETYYPNRHRGIMKYFSPPPLSPLEMKEALELEKPMWQKVEEHNEDLDKSIKAVKNRLKDMQTQQEYLQAMLQAVVMKLEISLEDDAGDEEELLIPNVPHV
ncbi:Transient receptor potential cation channel subfamily A member 1-like [Exaiptasia diaphana]|nr:Transient receptor potential cation channel subfamily A member 1-like [Exaiptasia diaphana]